MCGGSIRRFQIEGLHVCGGFLWVNPPDLPSSGWEDCLVSLAFPWELVARFVPGDCALCFWGVFSPEVFFPVL